MASVTAEVLLHFGLSLDSDDGRNVSDSVNELRFKYGIEDSRIIIDLITSAYWAGYAHAVEE